MAAYPSTVGPAEFPQNGWTETWSEHAPRISLAALSPTVADIAVPREVIDAWKEQRRIDNEAARRPALTEELRVRLEEGDTVVFTGFDDTPRSQWTERAQRCGLIVRSAVTPATSVLVASQPAPPTKKIREARLHGVPVIDYDAFHRILIVMEV